MLACVGISYHFYGWDHVWQKVFLKFGSGSRVTTTKHGVQLCFGLVLEKRHSAVDFSGGVLQEASKSGKLDEALELLRQEQQEVVEAAPKAGLGWLMSRYSSRDLL